MTTIVDRDKDKEHGRPDMKPGTEEEREWRVMKTGKDGVIKGEKKDQGQRNKEGQGKNGGRKGDVREVHSIIIIRLLSTFLHFATKNVEHRPPGSDETTDRLITGSGKT